MGYTYIEFIVVPTISVFLNTSNIHILVYVTGSLIVKKKNWVQIAKVSTEFSGKHLMHKLGIRLFDMCIEITNI